MENSELRKGDKVYIVHYKELTEHEVLEVSFDGDLVKAKIDTNYKETKILPYFYGHGLGEVLSGAEKVAYINKWRADDEIFERKCAHKWLDLINYKAKVRELERELNGEEDNY